MEPYNYIFVAWLRAGLFDRLCLRLQDSPAERNLQLMTVMAHIIQPRRLGPWQMATVDTAGPCRVRLPRLPADFAAAVETHNARACASFASLAATFVHNHGDELGVASVLPGATNHAVQGAAAASSAAPGCIAGDLAKACLQTGARSPFVATSGHGGHFGDTEDLVTSLRTGVYLDKSVVPSFDLNTEAAPLNAYAVDFFATGSREYLVAYNGFHKSACYDIIKEVLLNLKVGICHPPRCCRRVCTRAVSAHISHAPRNCW